MNRDDDYGEPEEGGGRDGRPTRDAKGRWLKGYCPDPKERPRKPPTEDLDLSDPEILGNTLIDVVSGGKKVTMLRRAGPAPQDVRKCDEGEGQPAAFPL